LGVLSGRDHVWVRAQGSAQQLSHCGEGLLLLLLLLYLLYLLPQDMRRQVWSAAGCVEDI
jgi:hypothetical protein